MDSGSDTIIFHDGRIFAFPMGALSPKMEGTFAKTIPKETGRADDFSRRAGNFSMVS